jgi:hypothetical protein
VLVSPGRSPPGTQRPAVQGSGDAAQRPTALAQASDLREGRLFAGIRFNVLAVFGETIAELDVADAFTVSFLVAQRVAGTQLALHDPRHHRRRSLRRRFPEGFHHPLFCDLAHARGLDQALLLLSPNAQFRNPGPPVSSLNVPTGLEVNTDFLKKKQAPGGVLGVKTGQPGSSVLEQIESPDVAHSRPDLSKQHRVRR